MADKATGSSHPDIRDLNRQIIPNIPPEKWKDLGLELLSGNSVEVNSIEADTQGTRQRVTKIFEKWLNRRDATWNKLIVALENIHLTYLADHVKKTFLSLIDEENGKPIKKGGFLSTKLTTPSVCSIEFAKLVSKIIIELKKNETENLDIIKDLCPHLSPEDDEKVSFFSKDQLKAIDACNDIRRMFKEHLCDCWRWNEFTFLEEIIKFINSSDCKSLLSQYRQNIEYKMKLKIIFDHCKKEKCSPPEGYSEMVAIIKDKNFFEITLEEYNEIKEFTAKHCGVKSWFLSPFVEMSPFCSVLIKWLVPLSAVSYMVRIATDNTDVFIGKNIVYLKISSIMVFDKRDNEEECEQLLFSACTGNVSKVERLINTRYIDVNYVNKLEHKTALHYSVEYKHTSLVETLISLGADVRIIDEEEKSVLYYATEQEDTRVLETLLKAGVDINTVDNDDKTALHYAVRRENTFMMDTLVRLGADVNVVEEEEKFNLLHHGVTMDNISIVHASIRLGADVNAVDEDNITALHYAVRRGNTLMVETLVSLGADVNVVDEEEKISLLHHGVTMDDVSVVHTLIKLGADINAVDKDNKTALHYAVRRGNTLMVETLVSLGADVNVVDEEEKLNLLHHGVTTDDVSIVLASSKLGADINAVDEEGKSVLHYATKQIDSRVVETLIEAGADINAVDKHNRTALHYAVEWRNASVVETLINFGADVNNVDKDDITALHYAVRARDASLVETLINFGADVNVVDEEEKITLLCYGVITNDASVICASIKLGADVNVVDEYNETPLHYAVSTGNALLVETLINSGADINIIDEETQETIRLCLEERQTRHVPEVELQSEIIPETEQELTDYEAMANYF